MLARLVLRGLELVAVEGTNHPLPDRLEVDSPNRRPAPYTGALFILEDLVELEGWMYCCRCLYRVGWDIESSSYTLRGGVVSNSADLSEVVEAILVREDDLVADVSVSSCARGLAPTGDGPATPESSVVPRSEVLERPAHVHGFCRAGVTNEGVRVEGRGESVQPGAPPLLDQLDRRLDEGVGKPLVDCVPANEAVSTYLLPILDRVPLVLSGETYDGGDPQRTLSVYEGGRSVYRSL